MKRNYQHLNKEEWKVEWQEAMEPESWEAQEQQVSQLVVYQEQSHSHMVLSHIWKVSRGPN